MTVKIYGIFIGGRGYMTEEGKPGAKTEAQKFATVAEADAEIARRGWVNSADRIANVATAFCVKISRW